VVVDKYILCLIVCRLFVPNIMNLGALKIAHRQSWRVYSLKFALFSVSALKLKDEPLITSKPARKLKHTNSILESFEL